jgi:hypothetical protein
MSTTQSYLEHNLRLVQSGRKSRAAGIRRCADCSTAFIADDSGLALCVACRPNHTRRCRTCQVQFPNTVAGDELCVSCRNQPTLFDTDTDSAGGETR